MEDIIFGEQGKTTVENSNVVEQYLSLLTIIKNGALSPGPLLDGKTGSNTSSMARGVSLCLCLRVEAAAVCC